MNPDDFDPVKVADITYETIRFLTFAVGRRTLTTASVARFLRVPRRNNKNRVQSTHEYEGGFISFMKQEFRGLENAKGVIRYEFLMRVSEGSSPNCLR